jgi:hypothetical protein
MMTNMMKGTAVQPSEGRGVERTSRRDPMNAGDPKRAFESAFVDALRDILQDERRRAA